MKLSVSFIATLVFSISLSSSGAFAFDPTQIVGQKAPYKIDLNPARTSSWVESGTIKGSVLKYVPDFETGPAFEVGVDYTFKIKLFGTKTGSEKDNIDAGYFKPEFLEQLRITKHYESPNFKADHQGYADAKNMDGKFYAHCDKVFLYDIKQSSGEGITEIGMALLAAAAGDDRANTIEDVKILAHIYPGVPVLGAVKLDASGLYSGTKVKAGGDYESAQD